ncbi:hypothetical protein LguiA_023419 [Lonicera macranthoides]
MASFPPLTSKHSSKFAFLFVCFFFISTFATSVSAFQFQVGGKRGWTKPSAKHSHSYNDWAAENRFQIGDTLYFKYHKDSVLVVNSSDYESCNTSNPISKFNDGDTVFEFDRSGFFYFISGKHGHCKSGQRLVIRVMHPSEIDNEAPESAPALAPVGGSGGGWDSDNWGPPGVGHSSANKASVASTALGGMLVVLYLLI